MIHNISSMIWNNLNSKNIHMLPISKDNAEKFSFD